MTENSNEIHFPMTIDKAFAEEIKKRGWWKSSSFDRKLASKHKELFTRGKLSYELKKVYLQSLGYEIASVELWEKKTIPEKADPLIILPDAISLMSYNFTTIQFRVMIAVIAKLQPIIEDRLQSDNIDQLNSVETQIQVLYSELGINPNKYNEVRSDLKDLSSIHVDISNGEEYQSVFPFLKPDISIKTHSRHFSIAIDSNVLNYLTNIENGFCKFNKGDVLSISNIYSARIYLLISKWRDIGKFVLSMSKFRMLLKLDDRFTKYAELYSLVLQPAIRDLYGKYDCWFEIAEKFNTGDKDPDLEFTVFSKEIF